jgi:hypothetical protein
VAVAISVAVAVARRVSVGRDVLVSVSGIGVVTKPTSTDPHPTSPRIIKTRSGIPKNAFDGKNFVNIRILLFCNTIGCMFLLHTY